MLRVKLTDGKGSSKDATVGKDGTLYVSISGDPPNLINKKRIFRQYMTSNGLPSGTFDMKVATSTDFYIPSVNDYDRFITAVSFMITDAAASLNKFGNITALTNGCAFEYTKSVGEIVTIHGSLKSNWDFVRMCLGVPSFGDAASVFRAVNVIGTDEAFIPVFNFLSALPPYGLKLEAGSTARLTLRVRDNTTGVDAFDVICYGFEVDRK